MFCISFVQRESNSGMGPIMGGTVDAWDREKRVGESMYVLIVAGDVWVVAERARRDLVRRVERRVKRRVDKRNEK